MLLEGMAKDEEELFARLDRLYETESARLSKEIAAYYQEYGEESVIEYRRLLASMSEDDRRLLMERMDEFARKYPQYAHLMPVRESIYRLDALEGLQASIRMQQLEIGAVELEEMRPHFERQAQRGSDYAAERLGFGSSFYSVNAPLIAATVGADWTTGGSYSDRLWANRDKLAAYLSDDIARMIARGVKYDECAKEVADRFGRSSRRDAKRLVYTEGTFLFNEAQAQVHEGEFEKYRISCVADGKACKICLALQDAQAETPELFENRKPGINFPPMHPWCRCSYEVVVDDWDAWIDAYVAAHGGDAATISYGSGATGRYYKPRSAFNAQNGWRDLFAHDALGNSGRSFIVPEENAPEGHSNIDLLIDGDRWEIKSPDGANLRAVELALRKAKRQFEKQYGKAPKAVRVVLNGRYMSIPDEDITKRLALEKERHGIGEVLQILKDGSILVV